MIKIIDTHVHIWDLNILRLPWLDQENPVLKQTYLLQDYEKAVKNDGLYKVEKAVYIEVDCAREYKIKENNYIINLCSDANSLYKGAVLSGYMDEPGFPEYIDHWSKSSSFVKGVRHVLHVPSAKRKTCLKKEFIDNVRYLGKKNLLFEACLRNEELEDLCTLAKACPDTKIVLNHMGIVNPDIIAKHNLSEAEKIYKEIWISNINKLGSLGNVWCKISGLNPSGEWTENALKPAVDFAIDAFGEDHIVFASNYPVCNVSTKADPWIKALINITESRGSLLQQKLFYENAKKLYKL
ncbi:MAG: amidohydrolase family protein [Clostridia bacterium]|jgi:predicted TIM-barrel fold metal-dependent hydrolase|nr:amidohydrolase family protein [Clostridia bacterium]MCI1999776.1 amidohydrolase family protein [Clostridia bacterium]MCI2014308.1 amidohydrolase family protein [Clostridia bacterium]